MHGGAPVDAGAPIFREQFKTPLTRRSLLPQSVSAVA